MTLTTEQLRRWSNEWAELSGETVGIEQIGTAKYAYGSELACLRLYYKFRHCGDRAKAGFSESRGTWFFRLEATQ